MPGDWIKLHRKLLDSPIMKHPELLHLWVYCLMKANWKDMKWLIPRTLTEVSVPRGAFVTGRETLHSSIYPKHDMDGNAVHRDWTPTSRTLWRWLEALEKMDCVKLNSVSNRCTVVTVCNYSAYQDQTDGECPADVQHVSSTCPADVPHVSTSKEGKNERMEESLAVMKPQEKKLKKPRQRAPRDDLFDAVAKITETDPVVSGSYIGRVVSKLSAAGPPYTPEEILRFPDVWKKLYPTIRVTLGVVEKNIMLVRRSGQNDAESMNEKLRKDREETRRNLYPEEFP